MSSESVAGVGQLHILVDTPHDGIDIVLVPGIGTTTPKAWPFASPDWLSTLPDAGVRTRILMYEYASPFASSKPSWESVLMLGYDFLQQLDDARSQPSPNLNINKPVLLVCHSLGGIVVKQALCVANKQFVTRYGSVINAIAGVIFLSTPHRFGDKTTRFIRFRDILEATTGRNLKIQSAKIEQEGAMLLDLADRFQGISFRTPILSFYELRESKNRSTPLRPK